MQVVMMFFLPFRQDVLPDRLRLGSTLAAALPAPRVVLAVGLFFFGRCRKRCLAPRRRVRRQRCPVARRASEIAIRLPRMTMPPSGSVGRSPELWYLTFAAAIVASIHAV